MIVTYFHGLSGVRVIVSHNRLKKLVKIVWTTYHRKSTNVTTVKSYRKIKTPEEEVTPGKEKYKY